MFKLTFVFFSYELYQRLIKQKLYKKTHDRYYTYWSAQILIFGSLIGLGIFAAKFQSNRVALDTFWGSITTDFVVAVVIIVIVTLKANPFTEWTCLRNADEGDAKEVPEGDSKFIPPPMLVCCQCCNVCPSNERCKRCLLSTKQVLIVLANGVSLFLFLAIGSYVAQALPAIAMSYYVNPTCTLIRLGFFELAIFILLMEFSYLIFLCDKLSWLCYVRFRRNLPDEISNELHFVSVYVNECTRVQPAPERQLQGEGTENTPLLETGSGNSYGTPGGHAAAQKPVGSAANIQPPDGSSTGAQGDATTPSDSDAKENGSTSSTSAQPPSNSTVPGQSTPGGPPGNPPPAPPQPPGGGTDNTPQNAAQQTSKEYSCRWYWLCIIFFQIIALLIVIGVSAPALFFLMQIVIDQTSSSNNDFKDLLTILPTIALNAWLLLKHGDIIHAMKEIMKSAIKEQRGAVNARQPTP